MCIYIYIYTLILIIMIIIIGGGREREQEGGEEWRASLAAYPFLLNVGVKVRNIMQALF